MPPLSLFFLFCFVYLPYVFRCLDVNLSLKLTDKEFLLYTEGIIPVYLSTYIKTK